MNNPNPVGVLAILFISLIAAAVALVIFTGKNYGSAADPMDKQHYARATTELSGWTGEVVQSEALGHNLYKVQVKRNGGEKKDTLLSISPLAVGEKIQYLQVVTLNHNNLPQITRFAVPVTK